MKVDVGGSAKVIGHAQLRLTSGGWGPMGDDAIHGMDAGMGGLRLAHDIP